MRTIPDDESAESSVGDILEDGWRHPAEVFHSAKGVLSTSYKANTFMASKGVFETLFISSHLTNACTPSQI